jgi:hypothetical protein
MVATFKDRHPEVQHLVRELELLRGHNMTFKAGDPQERLLMFAEASLVCLTLERFLRAILGDARSSDTMHNLLQRAIKRKLVRLPHDDQAACIRQVCDVRNTILHGDYEKAAQQSGRPTIEAYFQEQFAPEIEGMYEITQYIVRQIDLSTGQPRSV